MLAVSEATIRSLEPRHPEHGICLLFYYLKTTTRQENERDSYSQRVKPRSLRAVALPVEPSLASRFHKATYVIRTYFCPQFPLILS